MPSCFVLVDVFDDIEAFMKYLRDEVKINESYRVLSTELSPRRDYLSRDREVIVKLNEETYKKLAMKISKIRSYDGLRAMDILPCI